ncbi:MULTISPECIES: malto-oligosyltrehalose trehalohydrolase [Acidiplasma]|jgi:maltooligosyltrehalose trehalohydrolase|uniref:Malto-oligosyltrehalose trehalohydrolase n=1 Tax=Acidiplasma aeolicum TaxID=507754 RepID=A0A0Q1B8Q3_9ARCH|nr:MULTISPECIES: malto-oligosyltrehalose trehalohydrolase [Acidiplasma]KPV46292.1 hypothetical protein SE19_06160 [Acidiplasma aeolicum]KQB36685.1 hypothetical protein AOG54_01955 [Acidiplasma aeolicum]WMT55784.1 MAG: malto-oligosyltrehalose trehalohydrolase [Acidiplasma sp.]
MDELYHGIKKYDDNFILNVWAPKIKNMQLHLLDKNKKIIMHDAPYGFKSAVFSGHFGEKYKIIADGMEIPDPASRFQPEGINGPSQIINPDYNFIHNKWRVYDMNDTIIEEIHIGTFTKYGTYKDAEEKLEHFEDMGINTLEIMPLSQFYGTRNWGYDGVFPYAPAFSYGTPDELKHFIDRAHEYNINVMLDVVYNHVGPLGNILPLLGPYFSDQHKNPWGPTFNFDGPFSDPVRAFILQNVIYWINEYKFDGLRLDAIHSIYDSSPVNIIKEISLIAKQFGEKHNRKIKIVAETDKNDSSLVKSVKNCGYGLDAHWNDDFHHSIFTYLSGENAGYYSDYGGPEHIIRCLKYGYDYNGVYSNYLHKVRGTVFKNMPKNRLIVCDSNHDQIGNRAFGERPLKILGDKKFKFFAGMIILSPFTPMLFQGEEYGEVSPFLFFVDPPDKKFAESVFNGRKSEFSDFSWSQDVPNPADIKTFINSKLTWNESDMYVNYYKTLISLRKKYVSEKYKLYMPEKNVIKIGYENASVYFSLSEKDVKINGHGIIYTTSKNNIINKFDILIKLN